MLKTVQIPGVDVVLEEGKEYYAEALMGTLTEQIKDPDFNVVWERGVPSYEERYAFLNEFNNSPASWSFRKW